MIFLVAQFESATSDQEIAVIPKLWVCSPGTCFWPPYKTDERNNKAATRYETPDPITWTKCGFVQIGNEYADYLRAGRKRKRYINNQESSSATEKGRRRIAPSRFGYSSSSDDEQMQKKITPPRKKDSIPTLPKPPTLLFDNLLAQVGAPVVYTQEDLELAIHDVNVEGLQICELNNSDSVNEVLFGKNGKFNSNSQTTSGDLLNSSQQILSLVETPKRRNRNPINLDSDLKVGGATTTIVNGGIKQTGIDISFVTNQEHVQTSILQRDEEFSNNKANCIDNFTNKRTKSGNLPNSDFETMVLSSLALMNRKLDNLLLLQSRHNLNSQESLLTEPEIIDGIPDLPIKSLNELQLLETSLIQKEMREKFAKLLAVCGGINLTSVVKNVGTKLFDEHFATELNFHGLKGKMGFKRFKNICACFAGALRYNFPNETLTETKFQSLLGHWFTNVADRVKKRERRIEHNTI